MLPVSPSIRWRISAPAGERASGVDGNGRVCMGNLRVLQPLVHQAADTSVRGTFPNAGPGERSSVSHVARHTSSWEQLGLYTERLGLRAPTLHDAEALCDLFADEEVMEGLGREPVSA